MVRKVKLVIFDLDNTLFSFNNLWIKANKDTFEEYTVFKDIEYSDFMKLYKKYDLYFWKQHDEGIITLDELRELRLIKTLKCFDLNISREEANKYFESFFTKLLSSITVNRKMNDLLLSLKKNVNIAILTNGKLKEQNIKIDNLDIRSIFEKNIFISQNIGYEKPNPKAFLNVTSNLNVNPEECLFIGDSFKNDILGALNVNMAAIWLTNSEKDTKLYIKDDLCGCEDNIEVLLKNLLEGEYKGFTINN
ncbi:HAD family hydrolase [Staphylococcus aureus]|uniref:HAD family hydrolase n=1 Tax=Staphylococcus aureus TaxID=1280 RepID=UPI0018ED62BB|nr:HAD family hydrolase [Staphylococcus aureus]MBJ6275918.1 HAD family hydrolase [Staphylococcus aureus]MBJ6281135.1 HAD family hydrolase [Staphylococcus aureus]MBJ6283902.1 HAD family hydrolase [Staphylococcus aureus]MBJ6286623.1 HAD family hydrolase [Staphylococcus aureus]MBJ6299185.1 HAD family hydrolase [Staphylococcus aureus]